jgi:hypothetical protein
MAKLKYTSSRVTSRYRPATTRLGSTLRRSEGSLGRTRPSNTAPGAISSSSWDSSLHTCVEATVRYAAELGYEVDGEGRDRGLFG